MPLCTILTKWPAPLSPMWVTHGSPSALAAMDSKIGLRVFQDSSEPPGIMDGPSRAPSSPPDTPQRRSAGAGADFLFAADGVREVGVAGVDDDVTRLHQVGERVDHGVGRLTGLDHDDGGARLDEAVHEFLKRLRRIELAFAAMLVHELFGTGVGAVEHGHLVAVVSEIACEAAAHGSQTDDADVCFS